MYETRIVLGLADDILRRNIKDHLTRVGYLIVADVAEGRTAGRLAFNIQPDLIILEERLPLRSGSELARVLTDNLVAPVILILDNSRWETLDRCRQSGASALLVKPFSEGNLLAAVELVLANFQQLLQLCAENRRLKQAEENRRLVEKAKNMIMETWELSEKEAYDYIRHASQDRSLSMGRVAKLIVRQLEDG